MNSAAVCVKLEVGLAPGDLGQETGAFLAEAPGWVAAQVHGLKRGDFGRGQAGEDGETVSLCEPAISEVYVLKVGLVFIC